MGKIREDRNFQKPEDQVNQFINDPSNYPFIIDGGLSNVLEGQGCDLNHDLWTARILEEDPDAILRAHRAYIESGAQCIATSSYQATIPGLLESGYNRKAAEALILKSVKLAEEAVQQALDSGVVRQKPLIAASIGPYGAYLADGSEYRGNYGITDEALKTFHREKISILDNSGADLLAFETIPDIQEARVLADLLQQVNKPAWVSFSCKDEEHINDGSSIKQVMSLFRDHPKVFALGVNCTKPKFMSGLIKELKESAGNKKIIIYPNSGEAYHAESKTWSGVSDPNFLAEMTREWITLGADIIGGCCRIGPEHIKRMKQVLA